MGQAGNRKPVELAAVLIAPDRQLADQFCRTLSETRAFQVLTDLKKYPTRQTLEIRLRQLQPEVVLLDLATDPEAADELIQFMAAFRPAVHIIGLHRANDPQAVLRALRLGASEFLYAPFDAAVQRDAVAGILRLRQSAPRTEVSHCKVVAFASAKPGSGASILACQTALAVKRTTGQRILLADVDLTGGTLAFYLRVRHPHSFLDALERSQHMDPVLLASLTADCQGLDVLPAPSLPRDIAVNPDCLRQILDQARHLYDWVILDLPAIFQPVSLLALSESDCAFLVTTSELPSLHLARKAVNLLIQLGIGKDRFRVLVNRVNKSGGMRGSDLEKIFNCTVHSRFPNDYGSLHRVVTLGEPLAADCSLGKAIEDFAGRLAGIGKGERRRAGFLLDANPAFAGT